jgi:glycolate oxidase
LKALKQPTLPVASHHLISHNVEAIKMLTIDGEALSLSRQDTGLGLLALMNGSEGLLGIVTEVTIWLDGSGA